MTGVALLGCHTERERVLLDGVSDYMCQVSKRLYATNTKHSIVLGRAIVVIDTTASIGVCLRMTQCVWVLVLLCLVVWPSWGFGTCIRHELRPERYPLLNFVRLLCYHSVWPDCSHLMSCYIMLQLNAHHSLSVLGGGRLYSC